jgi:hypothetical protein
MNYKIKPFVVSTTDNLGLGSTVSYTAEAVSASISVMTKEIGSGIASARIDVNIYQKVATKSFDGINAGEDTLVRRDGRSVTSETLTKAGLTALQQKAVFKGLVFGTDAEQFSIVKQLISVFGLELLED